MAHLKLHLDADISIRALGSALSDKGHDVTRTPNQWMPLDASDQTQLLGATAQGRAIATFNIRDFSHLATQYPQHKGVILAHQRDWSLSRLISAMNRLLSEVGQDELVGQVRWLNDWA